MIIARYITREVLFTLMGILLVLLLVFLSQQFVRYLNYVAAGKIPTSILLQLVSFEIPYLLALLMPLGLYLALILVFGRLIADSEMAILQLYGFGMPALLRLTFLFSLLLGAAALILMIWVNPLISAKRQQVMASDEATTHLIQTLIPGRFQASPDGRQVMYVEKLSLNRLRAENIFLAQKKGNLDKDKIERHPWMLVFAKQGYQAKDKINNSPLFITAEGHRYEGTPGDNAYKIISFEKYAVRLPQNDPRSIHPETESLSMTQLWHDYQQPKQAAEWQWRFSIGIAVILLGLLAVPMSMTKPRQGRFLILIPAVLIYIVYMNLLFVARRWMEQGSMPVYLGLWWVHILICGLVVLLSWRHLRSWRHG